MTTILWPRSGDRQLKKVALAAASGAKVQFFSGGTTTPLTTYTDAGASTPHNAASLVTDGNGMWPNVFIPYGSFDYRILDSDDTIITTATEVPNPAPVDPTATDPNALMQTGDMLFSPAAVTRAGFVRANGNTIGSGASSATERANNDAETLFTWLWDNLADAQAAVSGGRGGTAAADWSANKTIATPDLRASAPIGLDDMGASAASRFASASFAHGNATTGGSVVGANTVTLVEGNLPAHTHAGGSLIAASSGSEHSHASGSLTGDSGGNHTHSGTTSTQSANHGHSLTAASGASSGTAQSGVDVNVLTSLTVGAINTGLESTTHTHTISIASSGAHSHTISGSTASDGTHQHSVTGTSGSTGSGTGANIVSRAVLGTWLLKL